MDTGQGRAGRIRAKNQEMAKMMKRLGIERTTGRCALCYKIVACDGPKSRNTHLMVCPGGK